MSTISIQRAHNLPHDEAIAAANKIFADLAHQYGVSSSWQGDTLHIDGAGVTGTLGVTAREMSLNLSLNFMAAMMKGVIVDGIEKKLSEVLGDQPA